MILLLYKFDILLLKQKKLPVLDIAHFFAHLGLHPSTQAEEELRYVQYGPLLLSQ